MCGKQILTIKPGGKSRMFVRLAALVLLASASMFADAISFANNYNAIVFGNLSNTSGGDIEGRALIGGNANLSNFSVGASLSQSGTRDDLIVGNNLTANGNWQVRGNAVYGGTLTGSVSHPGTSTTSHISNITLDSSNGNVVRSGNPGTTIAGLEQSLMDESTALGQLATTVGAITNFDGYNLTLSSTGTGLIVFNVDLSLWNTGPNGPTYTRTISAPSGSTVLINLIGSAATVNGGSMNLTGGIDTSHVLLNYYQATTFNASNFEFNGSILAPFTTTSTFSGGHVNGLGIFGGNATATNGWEWHNKGFSGNLGQPDTSSVPEPSTILLLGLGLVVTGLGFRKRLKAISAQPKTSEVTA